MTTSSTDSPPISYGSIEGKNRLASTSRQLMASKSSTVCWPEADAFVSNLGPGATTRIGIDAEQLAILHPQLTSLEISGYGTSGPLAGKRAYDLLVQAESGACAITGGAGAPAKPGPPMADACAGLYGVISILVALHQRGRTDRGTSTSVSLFDTMAELMGYALTYTRYTGVNQQPVGMGSPAVAPYGAYQTADNQTAILGVTNDAEFARLVTMVGRTELASDQRYRHNPDRVSHRAELDDVLATWCSQRTLSEVQQAADSAGIGNARYNTPLDVISHPGLAERDRWREIDSPVGPLISLLPPPIIANHEFHLGAIPALGEHSDRILGEIGFAPTTIESLRASGVVGAPPARAAE